MNGDEEGQDAASGPGAAPGQGRLSVRRLLRSDHDGWRPLWDGYNAFYSRAGATALQEQITQTTWDRFFALEEPVHALVAVDSGSMVGLAHYVSHRSTTRVRDVCCRTYAKTSMQPRQLSDHERAEQVVRRHCG